MLGKLAVLFLVGMVVMALFMARPRRRPGGGKGAPKKRPPGGGKLRAAAKCPDCGAWIVEGARCPCHDET